MKLNLKNLFFALTAIAAISFQSMVLANNDPEAKIYDPEQPDSPPDTVYVYKSVGENCTIHGWVKPYDATVTWTPNTISGTGATTLSNAGPDSPLDPLGIKTYVKVDSMRENPGEYTVSLKAANSASADDTDTSATIRALQLDILEVPDFLFTTATYWTPIKFQILPDSITVPTAAFSSIIATLHYDNGSGTEQTVEISGLESCFEAVTGDNTFECYIAPSYYSGTEGVNIPDTHYTANAYFTLEIDLSFNDSTGTPYTVTLESGADADGQISKRLADSNVFALDTRDNDTPFIVNGSNAFQEAPAKERYEAVEFHSSWDTWLPITGTYKEIKRVTAGYSGTATDNPLYWDIPSVPKWTEWERIYFPPGGDPYQVNAHDVNEYDHTVLAQSAAFALMVDGHPAMSTKAYMKQTKWNTEDPDYGLHWDNNIFIGRVTGLRYGPYFFISYGGKTPACISPNIAMDLGKDRGKGRLEWCQGKFYVAGKSEEPPRGDLLALTLNVGWALGEGLIGKVFGTAASIYDYVKGANPAGEEDVVTAKAEAFWNICPEGKTSDEWDSTTGVHMARIGTPLSLTAGNEQLAEQSIGVFYGFDSEPVGTMVSVFVELSSAAQGESRPTGFGQKEIWAQSSYATAATPTAAEVRLYTP